MTSIPIADSTHIYDNENDLKIQILINQDSNMWQFILGSDTLKSLPVSLYNISFSQEIYHILRNREVYSWGYKKPPLSLTWAWSIQSTNLQSMYYCYPPIYS
jgi:hypothetical protein